MATSAFEMGHANVIVALAEEGYLVDRGVLTRRLVRWEGQRLIDIFTDGEEFR